MLLGKVRGNAVCTLKYPGTEGLKLLIVQPLNKRLEPLGPLQVAGMVVVLLGVALVTLPSRLA